LADLGQDGNEAVAARLERYRAKPRATPGTPLGRRVLVTGFGLFKGVSFNISGLVAAALARPDLTPGDATLRESDHGGRAWERRLEIRGVATELCAVTLDVLWDLAAAVVAHEMERWQPELVVLLGRGSEQAIFETGAIDAARAMPGFAADGARVEGNLPLARGPDHGRGGAAPEVTTSGPAPTAIAMTWNAAAAHAATADAVRALGFEATVAPGARPANDYICNNVSYTALCAAAGSASLPLELAGGRVRLATPIASRPRVGFLHLPSGAGDDDASVAAWARIVLDVLATA
jgi:hypothetical protein